MLETTYSFENIPVCLMYLQFRTKVSQKSSNSCIDTDRSGISKSLCSPKVSKIMKQDAMMAVRVVPSRRDASAPREGIVRVVEGCSEVDPADAVGPGVT